MNGPDSLSTDVKIATFDTRGWENACAPFRDRNLIQTHAYATAKAATGSWEVERGTIRSSSHAIGVFQALIRRMPAGLPGGLVWINRGPLWRTNEAADRDDFDAALGALRRHYVDELGFYLRIAPPTADRDGRVPAGYQPAGAAGWASARVDLTPDDSLLRKALQQKWRNCLNKGERNGFDILRDSAGPAFETFVAEHDRFVAAAGFETSVTGTLLRQLPRDSDIGIEALVAQRGDAFLGGALIVDYGDTAEYLAGSTTDEGRKLNAGQVLLWQALCSAKSRGRALFDVGGMDDVLTPPGIFRFKAGLGGQPYRLADELEAVPRFGIGALTSRLVRVRVRRARVST